MGCRLESYRIPTVLISMKSKQKNLTQDATPPPHPMSSFFKGACVISWFTWLLSISVLAGTVKLIDNHVYKDPFMETNLAMLDAICYINFVICLVGCVFLKCGITHIICAILYLLPTGIIIPSVCIWGAVRTSQPDWETTPLHEEYLDEVKRYYSKHNKFPMWLFQTEEEEKCCGINGPLDYRQIFRELGHSFCIQHEDDVPCSCCIKRTLLFDEYQKDIRSCQVVPEHSHCKDANGHTDWLKRVIYTSSDSGGGSSNNSFETSDKCDPKKELNLNGIVNGTDIFPVGCYDELANFNEMLKNWMSIFFIFFTILSLLKAGVYLQTFVKSEVVSGPGRSSTHSLDVETLSILDLPTIQLDPITVPTEQQHNKSRSSGMGLIQGDTLQLEKKPSKKTVKQQLSKMYSNIKTPRK